MIMIMASCYSGLRLRQYFHSSDYVTIQLIKACLVQDTARTPDRARDSASEIVAQAMGPCHYHLDDHEI